MTTRFQRGGVASPLTAATTNALLEDADRPLYEALSFANDILVRHLEDRFQAELTSAGVSIANNPDGYVVGSSLPFDPTLYPLESQLTFPLLAVWRSEERYDEQTVHWKRTRSTWVIDYLLPPLGVLEAAKIAPMVKHVARVLKWGFERGLDETGDSKWHDGCDVDSVRVVSCKFGPMELRNSATPGLIDQVYQGLTMTLEVDERDQPVAGDYDQLETLDGYVDLTTEGLDELTGFVGIQAVDLYP